MPQAARSEKQEMIKLIAAFFHQVLGLHDWGPYYPIEHSPRGAIYRRECRKCTAEKTVYAIRKTPR
jgi:hypothetical protein